MVKKIRCSVCLFCIGGFLYTIIEILWRGYTHWTMFFVGGACFNIIGRIQTLCKKGIVERCSLCALAVTTIEFISGCIINLWMKLNVWDYSSMWLNIKGQVCLLYSVLWGVLSLIEIPVYSRCREHLAGGKKRAPVLKQREATTN